jgi:hypothetical protein
MREGGRERERESESESERVNEVKRLNTARSCMGHAHAHCPRSPIAIQNPLQEEPARSHLREDHHSPNQRRGRCSLVRGELPLYVASTGALAVAVGWLGGWPLIDVAVRMSVVYCVCVNGAGVGCVLAFRARWKRWTGREGGCFFCDTQV